MKCNEVFNKLENLSDELRKACLDSIRYEGALVEEYILNGKLYFNMYSVGFGSNKSLMNDFEITFDEFNNKSIKEIIDRFNKEELFK